MKCPACQFVCSPLRDICPRCFIDLRAFKREGGLQVTNPKASYEELLQKAGIRAPKKKVKEKAPEGSSLLKGLKKIFVRSPEQRKEEKPSAPPVSPVPPEQKAAPARVTETKPPPVKPVPVMPAPLPPAPEAKAPPLPTGKEEGQPAQKAPVQRTWETEKIPESFTRQELKEKAVPGKIIEEKPSPVKPAVPVISAPFQPAAEMKEPSLPAEIKEEETALTAPVSAESEQKPVPSGSVANEQVTEKITGKQKQPEPTAPASHAPEVIDFSSAGVKDLSGLIDQMLGDSDLEIEVVKEEEFWEKPKKPAAAKPAPPPAKPEPTAPSPELESLTAAREYFEVLPVIEVEDDTAPLFSASFLDAMKGEDAVEFSAEFFAPPRPSEEMEVFFDLAQEAIENPESEKKYVKEISRAPSALTESAALKKQLAAYEKSVAAMRPTLAGGAAKAKKEMEEPVPLPPPPEPASIGVHLRTFLVDGFAVTIISSLISILALWSKNPDLPLAIAGDISLDQYDLIYFAGSFLAAFPIVSIIYPLYYVLTRGSTRGMQATGLLILEERGLPPSKANVTVRAICFPMSALFLGWVPMLFGKRSLHDRLARTMVTAME